MKESLEQLRGYLVAIKRYRWPMLATAAMICLLGWTGVLLMADRYEATSKLLLTNKSMMGPLLKGLAAESQLTKEMASLMRKTLLSRPNLERVIAETDLDLDVKSAEEREALVRELGQKIYVKGDGRSKIYTISYVGNDPQLVKDVVQVLTNIFIENSVGATRKDSYAAQEFLTTQIKEYEAKLEQAETKLKDFKSKNVGLMPTEGGNYFSQLNQKLNELQVVELEYQEAVKRRNAIRDQLGHLQVNRPRAQKRQSTDVLAKEIEKLQSKLEDLTSRYTDSYPEVVSLRERLQSLLRQQSANPVVVTDDAGNMEFDWRRSMASRDDLRLELGKTEGEVAALRVRVKAFSKQVKDLRERVDIMPKVEADLAQLNRDYTIIKKTYEGLVQRREAAMLSDQAEASSNDLQFQVIEPPVVPTLPTAPDRGKLITLVLIAGIGLGAVLAIALAQINMSISSIDELRKATTLSILGSISRLPSLKQDSEARRRIALLGFSWSLLFLLYGGLIVAEIKHQNLVYYITKLIGGDA